MSMYHIYLALFFQMAARGSAQEATVGKMCSSHDATCTASEPGSRDDTQVLLQSQTKMEVAKHSHAGKKETLNYDVSVNPHAFMNSMTVTAIIKFGDSFPKNGKLVAYVGGAVQGVHGNPMTIPPPLGPYGGKPCYHLMVYGHVGDDGKEIAFKYFDEATGLMADLKKDPAATSAMTFSSDGIIGNAVAPHILVPDFVSVETTATAAATVCADKTQAEFDTYMATNFPQFPGSYTCDMFVAWGQCAIVAGECDLTCGVCGTSLSEKTVDLAKKSESSAEEALKTFLESATKMDFTKHSKSSGTDALAFDVTVNPPDFMNSMTVTAMVKIGDALPTNGKLVALVEGVVQGVCADAMTIPPTLGPHAGKPIYHLMIYGNSGDEGKPIKFKYFGPNHEEADLGSMAMSFHSDDAHGNAIDPHMVTAGSASEVH